MALATLETMRKLVLLGILLLLLGAALLAGKHYANHLADQKIRQAVKRVAKKATVDYKDVDIRLLDLDLAVNNIDVSLPGGQALTIDSVVVHDVDIKNRTKPKYLDISFYGVRVAVNQKNFGKHHKELNELGYTEFNVDANVSYVYNEAEQRFALNRCLIEAENLGNFDIELTAGNILFEELKKGNVENLLIEHMHFVYEDRTLMRKIVENANKNEKESIDFLVGGLSDDIERVRANNNEQAAVTMQEIINYLRVPIVLNVEVGLAEPTAVSQIMAAKKISEILSMFTIRVNSGGLTPEEVEQKQAEQQNAQPAADADPAQDTPAEKQGATTPTPAAQQSGQHTDAVPAASAGLTAG